MKGDFLPDCDNVTRLCGGSHVDPDTGKPSPGAFMLRADESYLSVNWLEYFEQYSHEDRLSEIRRVLAGKMKVGKAARLALLNVGGATQIVGDNPLISFTHEPLDGSEAIVDLSHCGINNIQSFEQIVAEKLSQAVYELTLAREHG